MTPHPQTTPYYPCPNSPTSASTSTRRPPIGQFQALLYLPFDGGWEGTLEPLRSFFAELPPDLAHDPEPARLAAAVRDYFVQQRGVGSVRMVDRLDVYIEWFYKVSLEGTGYLEAFEVRYVDWQGSTWPDGRSVVWGIAADTTKLWASESHPADWKVVLDLPLGLRAHQAPVEG